MDCIVDIAGKPVDFKFIFDSKVKSNYSVKDLDNERFVQDTIVSNYGFQMIRPVVVPTTEKGTRSITFSLDSHPYAVNYTIKDINNGLIQFQHNLIAGHDGKGKLLERFYFNADSLETLRQSMYAVKYFNKEGGTFKLVYYATQGQLFPPK